MNDIPPRILNRLYKTLLNCGPFENDKGLRAVFVDKRISPWRDSLPQANSPNERVRITVDFLKTK